jgi:uncharacterized MAPEG superfamily protein
MSCCSALIVKLADKAHWAMLFRVTRDEHAGASWLSADAVMAHKDAAETAAAFIAIVFTHFSSSTPGPKGPRNARHKSIGSWARDCDELTRDVLPLRADTTSRIGD